MALLQKNLSQLEVESVEIQDNIPAPKQDSKLETLISGCYPCPCCTCPCGCHGHSA